MQLENKANISETLITRYLSGEATPSEEEKLLSWRSESPDNEQLFIAFQKAKDYGVQHYRSEHNVDVDVEEEWQHFINAVKDQPEVRDSQVHRFPLFRQPWLRVAAVILMIVSIGFVINYALLRSSGTVYQASISTKEFVLPDGSHVTLNMHSTLSFSDDFGESDRRVELSGEAFFDVAKDRKRPFIIRTTHADVQVLGTSFNVKDRKHKDLTEVTVASGMVKFGKKDSDHFIVLKAGDQGVLAADSLIGNINDNPNFLAWKTRKLVFDNTPLQSVMQTLKEVYQVDIVWEENFSGTCEVTVTFDQQSIASVMNVLKSTLDIEYLIKGKKIEISHIGC